MNGDLLKPTLKNESLQETESYDIRKFFYLAFFGGVIPTMVLGSINALQLKVNKKIIYLLGFLGVILLLIKAALTVAMFQKQIDINPRAIRLIARADSIILYLLYYWAMKKQFQQHLILNGTVKPLLRDALIWIGIGFVVETALIGGGILLLK